MASTSTTFDTDCKLMLHMDGADASTTFTDSSSGAKTVTANGNAQIDTAQSKFGGASGLFDASGDYLSLADSADWDFGTGDFTIDFWLRYNSQAGAQTYISRGATADFSFERSGGTLYFYLNSAANVSYVWSPSNGVWYHLAVTRSGTSVRVFIDGTQVGSTGTSSFDINSANSVLIGSRSGGQYLDGWLDELRVVKGTAVWTANFTPPTAAYTSGSGSSTSKSFMLMGVGT